MKALLSTLLVGLAASTVNAAEILDARVDAANGTIEVDVQYGGGCEEHKFELRIGSCLESMPVQCGIDLVDVSEKPDYCEALIGETVKFNIAELGMNDSYYSQAAVEISGSNKTAADITLPSLPNQNYVITKEIDEETPADEDVIITKELDEEVAPDLPLNSPQVLDARIDSKNGTLEVDVQYGGGCEEHKFELQVGGCLESMPVQCGATVVDVSEKPDFCEALIGETVKFDLKEVGLNDGYYSQGKLGINGSNDSRAILTLPNLPLKN